MKTIVAGLIFIAACLFFYHQQHPFGRPSIPRGHDYTAKGVYFLRTPYSIPSPSGTISWTLGQRVFEDPHATTAAPEGMVMVTDGSHSAPIPNNMLSQDMQEGQELQQTEFDARSVRERQAQVAANAAEAKARTAEANARATEAKAEAQAEAQARAQEAKDREQERLLRLAELERQRAARMAPSPTPKFGHTALDQPTKKIPNPRYNPTYPYPTPDNQ